MADADYRALLLRAAGVRSSADLDELGFEAVIPGRRSKPPVA